MKWVILAVLFFSFKSWLSKRYHITEYLVIFHLLAVNYGQINDKRDVNCWDSLNRCARRSTLNWIVVVRHIVLTGIYETRNNRSHCSDWESCTETQTNISKSSRTYYTWNWQTTRAKVRKLIHSRDFSEQNRSENEWKFTPWKFCRYSKITRIKA